MDSETHQPMTEASQVAICVCAVLISLSFGVFEIYRYEHCCLVANVVIVANIWIPHSLCVSAALQIQFRFQFIRFNFCLHRHRHRHRSFSVPSILCHSTRAAREREQKSTHRIHCLSGAVCPHLAFFFFRYIFFMFQIQFHLALL